MAVQTISAFRTMPGRAADHMAASTEAVGHLRRMGLQSVALQPIAGTDVGQIAVTTLHADNAAHVASLQTMQSDGEWLEFFGRVSQDSIAEQVESSILTDVDPNFQPDANRPLGVVQATQWRPFPGRAMEFGAHIETGVGHISRMGGNPRVMQTIIGLHPISTVISVGFADLDAYGEYADKSAADEQFNGFMTEILTNPTADLIRSGLYINIS